MLAARYALGDRSSLLSVLCVYYVPRSACNVRIVNIYDDTLLGNINTCFCLKGCNNEHSFVNLFVNFVNLLFLRF